MAGNPIGFIEPLGLAYRANPWDSKVYPPETNCSFTDACVAAYKQQADESAPDFSWRSVLSKELYYQFRCGQMNSCACSGGSRVGKVCEYPDGWLPKSEPKKPTNPKSPNSASEPKEENGICY